MARPKNVYYLNNLSDYEALKKIPIEQIEFQHGC
jgi:hypothetical protein